MTPSCSLSSGDGEVPFAPLALMHPVYLYLPHRGSVEHRGFNCHAATSRMTWSNYALAVSAVSQS
eukprot:11969566-Heterocapsa_arctica.AAC.1